MYKIYKNIFILPLLLGLLCSVSSCISDDVLNDSSKEMVKEAYLKIEFNLPNYQMPLPHHTVQSRAMDANSERVIDPKKIAVIAFDNSTDKKYLYTVPVLENSLQYNDSDPRKATLIIKLVKSDKPINLMFIANYEPPIDKLVEGDTKWSDFIKELKFVMPIHSDGNNIWNASTQNSTPFPLYGSLKVNEVSENMGKHDVVLYRSLARVDIGLNFEINTTGIDGPYSEKTKGLDNFKLEQVFVYRTYEDGFVAPIHDDFKTKPSIVPNSKKRDNKSPLKYHVYEPEGQSLIREIYLPESDGSILQPNVNLNNTIHTIVIAGSFEGGVTSYYRLDFAQDINNGSRNYYSILRNHRYLFNITKVLSSGFTTVEKALASTSTANLEYQLVVWDESIHEMHIQGEHYLGIDNHKIEFSSRLMGNNHQDDYVDLKYQTNYPITDMDVISFEWETALEGDVSKSPYFEVIWDKAKKQIRISKKSTNVSNAIFSDVLHVKLGNFDIPVVITQNYLDFKYTLDCSSVVLNGVYRPAIKLNENSNTIELKFIAENRDMIGLEYIIETVRVNGIIFRAKGTITEEAMENKGGQKVILKGSGTLETPEDKRIAPFIVTIESNSSSGSFCEVTVSPVFGKINLITHGSGKNTYGYNLSGESPANRVLNHYANFGPNDDSRVKIEGFNIIDGGLSATVDKEVKLWLTGEKKLIDPTTQLEYNVMADIYHIGYSSTIRSADIPILLNFMKNGGVVILFMENNSPLPMLKAIYHTDILSMGSHAGLKALPLLGNSAFRVAQNKSIEDWEHVLEDLRKDPILNGPFGDIAEFQWGEDASIYYYIKNFPEDDRYTTIYSRDYTLTDKGLLSTGSEGVSAFKYESDVYNLVFIGDGGFNSQTDNTGGSTLLPFVYDEQTLFPVPNLNYNPNKNTPVYNSQMFCNIFAWAIDRANSPELRSKKDSVLRNIQN